MYRSRKSGLLVVGAFLFAGIAAADTLVTNCSTVGPIPTELNATVSCGQFDSSLGTLTSISIEIDGEITGSITLTNNALTPQIVKATTASDFSLAAPLAGFTFPSTLFEVSFTTGVQSLAAGTPTTFSNLDSGVDSATNSQSSTFAPYEGLGTFSVGVQTVTGITVLGGGGNVVAGQSTDGLATAIVTYNYTPAGTQTPEPTTFAFLALGGGLVALGASRRKSRN